MRFDSAGSSIGTKTKRSGIVKARSIRKFLLGGGMIALLSACGDPASEIVGKWSAGDVMIEFTKSGKVIVTEKGEVFAGTYEVKDDGELMMKFEGFLGFNPTAICRVVSTSRDAFSFEKTTSCFLWGRTLTRVAR